MPSKYKQVYSNSQENPNIGVTKPSKWNGFSETSKKIRSTVHAWSIFSTQIFLHRDSNLTWKLFIINSEDYPPNFPTWTVSIWSENG